MSNGFIKIPRELLNNPSWKDLPYTYRHVFLTILSNAAFKEQSFTDHGESFILMPGQFCTTLRQLVKLCDEPDIDKSLIERALSRFKKVGFSRQESRHLKTVITITESSICSQLENKIETDIETRSRQDRDIKKKEEERKEDKEVSNDTSFAQSLKAPRKKIDIAFDFSVGDWENITADDMTSWKEIYPILDIKQELGKMREWILSTPSAKSKKLWRKFITGWLSRANEKSTNFASAKSQYKSYGKSDRRTQNTDGTPVASQQRGW